MELQVVMLAQNECFQRFWYYDPVFWQLDRRVGCGRFVKYALHLDVVFPKPGIFENLVSNVLAMLISVLFCYPRFFRPSFPILTCFEECLEVF